MTVKHMGKHFETVLNLQQEGQDWRLHGRCFRRAVAGKPPVAKWGQVHSKLLNTARAGRDIPPNIRANRMGTQDNQSNVPTGYCARFHKLKKCLHYRNPEKCNYSHNCFRCNQAHAVYNCKIGVQPFRPAGFHAQSTTGQKLPITK